MKRYQAFVTFVLVVLVALLAIAAEQQMVMTANLEKYAESPDERLMPRFSFVKTVFDLGDVGQGTRNECEFRFTNTGRDLLKIGKISRTCGCTVFHLDKKEYKIQK